MSQYKLFKMKHTKETFFKKNRAFELYGTLLDELSFV